MARYVDVEKIIRETKNHMMDEVYPEWSDRNVIDALGRMARLYKKIIDDTPTADVAEVKHGYNKTSMHPVDEFYCSECGFCCADYTETKYDEDGDYTYSCECEFDYCPRCGAKMDKEKAQ